VAVGGGGWCQVLLVVVPGLHTAKRKPPKPRALIVS